MSTATDRTRCASGAGGHPRADPVLRFIEDNWSLGRIGSGSADSAAGNLENAFDFNQKFGHAPAVILDDTTGEVTKVIQPDGSSSNSSSAAPSSGTGSSSGSGSPSSTGQTTSHNGSVILVKLPNVACSHATGRRAIVLTCTTKGGSRVQTLIRARLLHGRKLISNKAALVKHNRVKLTLSLGRQSRGGRYTIRLSIDAGGRVGSQTRYVRVR